MGGFGDILSAGSSIAGMFGGEDGGDPAQSSSQSASGYAALPPEGQAPYKAYFDLVNSLFGAGQPRATQYGMVGQPTSPFDSSELYRAQQANGNTPINPIGVTEPFNPWQKAALSSMANPDYSQSGLSPYMNPFQDQVIDRTVNAINTNAAQNKNTIMDRSSLLNNRAMGSALGTQLAQNDKNTQQNIADAVASLGYQGYNSALDLRNNSLQQQLGAGSTVQQQNQNQLNAANPQTAYQMTPGYMQASMLGPLFNYFPQSSTSSSQMTGATEQTPSTASRVGGLGMSIFGTNGLSNIFGK